jgi:hypothetical protein
VWTLARVYVCVCLTVLRRCYVCLKIRVSTASVHVSIGIWLRYTHLAGGPRVGFVRSPWTPAHRKLLSYMSQPGVQGDLTKP